jgi:hypothetical protein
MHEVASGTKFAVFVLVEVAAHLLLQGWLVHYQLFQPVREVATSPKHAKARLCKSLAQLEFALARVLDDRFVLNH